jgi:cytochrome c biogenesis protein CcmG, thiol:disulfide interchange protein DsbE
MPPSQPGNSDLGWNVANTQHVRLADYKDKVLVLDFYATWCDPCRASIPNLIDLQKRYGPQGLQVVGLNVGGPDDPAEVPAFARELKIQYQLGIPDPELEQLYMDDSGSIPQTVVIDRKGAIQKRFVGYSEEVNEELESAIQKSLASAK